MHPKEDLVHHFKPVVPWPHVEGVEVDLNSIRLKHGETHSDMFLNILTRLKFLLTLAKTGAVEKAHLVS